MNRSGLVLSAALMAGLAACAIATPPPSVAIMPPGALGTNGDIDTRSLDVAAYDFAHHMQNDPARAADAVAALDYMGGQLNVSPRWMTMMPALFRLQMLQSRESLRQYVGINAAAPSQTVVDTMLALAQAYRAGDQAGVMRLLATPIFTVPPAEVQSRLSDIPVMPTVNNATTHADQYSSGFGFYP
ncbi:hypothetical protein [Acidisoma cladoniae]|uniref:hypothetical protein n=1 Tax=Acidisoma cladoniae TaxID=3040935 RepID=UPI002549DB6A|nr:hypothetical protein [Acidisoma sp. PAMC 29798]